jgi:hypothetical protein
MFGLPEIWEYEEGGRKSMPSQVKLLLKSWKPRERSFALIGA